MAKKIRELIQDLVEVGFYEIKGDLITGIHGNDPQQVYRDLCEVIEDVIHHFDSENPPLNNYIK